MADLSIQGALALSRPSNLTLGDISIRTDAAGRYCLNDLHKAAGGEPKHTPGRFTITQQFTGLANELSRNQDSPAPIESTAGIGTFVARELVIAYAAWISPAFHLKVIRYFLDGHANQKGGVSVERSEQPRLPSLAGQFVFSSGLSLKTATDPETGDAVFNWNDVCALLGYTASPSLPRRYLLQEGDIKRVVVRNGVGHYPTNHVTRGGLERALARCCKPATGIVRSWLMTEVFPVLDGKQPPREVPLSAPMPRPPARQDQDIAQALELASVAMKAMASVIQSMNR